MFLDAIVFEAVVVVVVVAVVVAVVLAPHDWCVMILVLRVSTGYMEN